MLASYWKKLENGSAYTFAKDTVDAVGPMETMEKRRAQTLQNAQLK
jgi:hypothetical protein